MRGTPTDDANCSLQANQCSFPDSRGSLETTKCSSSVCFSVQSVASLVVLEDQRHLRAGGHAVAGQLFILGPHLVLLENRITRLVDREQVWIDGVALGMAHASGLLDTNLHKVSFFDGFGK